MPACDIARILGAVPVARLAGWQHELATVLADLADDAGLPCPFDRHDPAVALLRALGMLATQTPHAASPLARQLADALALADQPNSTPAVQPNSTPAVQPNSADKSLASTNEPAVHNTW